MHPRPWCRTHDTVDGGEASPTGVLLRRRAPRLVWCFELRGEPTEVFCHGGEDWASATEGESKVDVSRCRSGMARAHLRMPSQSPRPSTPSAQAGSVAALEGFRPSSSWRRPSTAGRETCQRLHAQERVSEVDTAAGRQARHRRDGCRHMLTTYVERSARLSGIAAHWILVSFGGSSLQWSRRDAWRSKISLVVGAVDEADGLGSPLRSSHAGLGRYMGARGHEAKGSGSPRPGRWEGRPTRTPARPAPMWSGDERGRAYGVSEERRDGDEGRTRR